MPSAGLAPCWVSHKLCPFFLGATPFTDGAGCGGGEDTMQRWSHEAAILYQDPGCVGEQGSC